MSSPGGACVIKQFSDKKKTDREMERPRSKTHKHTIARRLSRRVRYGLPPSHWTFVPRLQRTV